MKMDLDRRSFLAGATGALSLSLLPLSGWAIRRTARRMPCRPRPSPASKS